MNRLSKEKRNQLIAIAAGTLAVSAALWYFVMTSQYESLAKYQETIDDTQNKIEKAQRLIKRRASIEADLAGLTHEIAQVESKMIPVHELSGKKWIYDKLINFIKDRYDITLINLSNDPVMGKQFLLLPKLDYSGAEYTVELRAFFHEFGKFLADFENSFPYLRIQNLEIWPLATPSAARHPGADLPEELLNSEAREQVRISMGIVVFFKPAGTS